MANVVEIDLECGGGRSSAASSDDGSLCFSDADEGSCYSQFYSTADGSYDDEIGEVAESRRVSSAAESDCSVEVGEIKVYMGKVDRDCRICQLSLESGIAIELGCSCKDDLAAAHSHCAETWFKIKGNKTCEICNSLATNVVGANETESAQRTNDANGTAVNAAASAPTSQTIETRSCLNGHRFINFLLACMVFAFVISWLFHFNIPS
ncbi:hypothetical protein LguiA_032127 [Lonicera macranthoides]